MAGNTIRIHSKVKIISPFLLNGKEGVVVKKRKGLLRYGVRVIGRIKWFAISELKKI